MRTMRFAGFALAVLLTASAAARASTTEKVTVRGQTLTLTVYAAPGPARGTILIGSGDVGWVGLAASLAEEYSARGFTVVGINVRQYLAAFTSGKTHLDTADVPRDYRAIADFVRGRNLLTRPVVLAGVSEGAALAVLAASDPGNHEWADGVVTMGLPPSAELAWRWTDAASWITKHDAAEPSFAPADVIARVAPLPLYMIQSTRDEYVSAADYERFRAAAREPRQLILIDASNHRFTDRRRELSAAFASGLDWIGRLAGRTR